MAAQYGMDIFVFGVGFYCLFQVADLVEAVDVARGKAEAVVASLLHPHHRAFLVAATVAQQQKVWLRIFVSIYYLLNARIVAVRTFFANTGAKAFFYFILKTGARGIGEEIGRASCRERE